MEPITVKYKVLDPRAKTPAYATPGSAAADLCAVLDEPLTVQPMQRVLVPTGLAIELPGAHAVGLAEDFAAHIHDGVTSQHHRAGMVFCHGEALAPGQLFHQLGRSGCSDSALVEIADADGEVRRV